MPSGLAPTSPCPVPCLACRQALFEDCWVVAGPAYAAMPGTAPLQGSLAAWPIVSGVLGPERARQQVRYRPTLEVGLAANQPASQLPCAQVGARVGMCHARPEGPAALDATRKQPKHRVCPPQPNAPCQASCAAACSAAWHSCIPASYMGARWFMGILTYGWAAPWAFWHALPAPRQRVASSKLLRLMSLASRHV